MSKWTNVFLPDTVVIRSMISDDEQAVSVAVQNLMVVLLAASRPIPPGGADQPGRTLGDPPLVASRTATLYAPITSNDAEVRVRVEIEATAELEPGARAVLVSRLAGATFV